MKSRVFVRPLVSSLIAALALTVTAVGQNQPVINVNNVEGLYAAVNNPANAGTIVVLASGTYTLTPKDPNNQARPNGGQLVLQSGMALVGQNKYVDFDGDGVWDPRDDNADGIPDTDPLRGLIFAEPASETIINAVNLSVSSAGAVRVGLDVLRFQPQGRAAGLLRVKREGHSDRPLQRPLLFIEQRPAEFHKPRHLCARTITRRVWALLLRPREKR